MGIVVCAGEYGKKIDMPKPSNTPSRLHPRNAHRDGYDLAALTKSVPELAAFVQPNRYGNASIDFANPKAVLALNKALLIHHYGITSWQIPEGYLCPAVPGRADYLHHIADVLAGDNFGKVPTGAGITCMDIGVGASCVYPIIGHGTYGWSFIGSEVDPVAVASAQKIVTENENLQAVVEIRQQPSAQDFFYGAIGKEERIDVTICNPPFHASAEAAEAATLRKQRNLQKKRDVKSVLNFGGQGGELWTEGGEKRFVRSMIRESKQFSWSCLWFSTLISKQSNLKGVETLLETVGATAVRTIPMGTGNKTSRIVAWSFQNKLQAATWRDQRWKS